MPLDRKIAEILREPGRHWSPRPPADDESIADLVHRTPHELPAEYLELLRFCNGGEGELNAPPLLFVLHTIAEAIEYNESDFRCDVFPEFWFFGHNGSLEQIAFDLRRGPPWQIVAIDPIAGPSSAEVSAGSLAEFVPLIGIAADDLE